MKRKRYSVEQIISQLREAEVRLSQGQTVKEVSRGLGITEQTYYRWRKEYGGLKNSQARRLKDLERENSRLKKAVAELTLDKVILKEALEGNYKAPTGVADSSLVYKETWEYRRGRPAEFSVNLVPLKGSPRNGKIPMRPSEKWL